MAPRRIECPHCQHGVEVDDTHPDHVVDCPGCGRHIHLHEDAAPQKLQGDVYHRMAHDPEVRRNLRRLQGGTVVVFLLIVILCVVDHFRGKDDSMIAAFGGQEDATAIVAAPAAQAPSRRIISDEGADPALPDAKSLLLRHPSDTVSAAPAPVTSQPDAARATKLVESFLNAKNVDERLGLIRDVKVMEPIMRDYYTSHPDGPIPFTRIEALPGTAAAPSIAFFDVHLPGGQKRRAIAGRSSTGEYRVDWASFVVYSAMDWKDFIEERPETPVFMRVLVEPGSQYSGLFADTGRFFCIKLTDPLSRSSPPLYAYAPRRSELEQALSMILREYPGEPLPMILRLKHPPQPEAKTGNQVLIEELIGEGWITRGM